MARPPSSEGACQRTPSSWSPGVTVSSRTGPGVVIGGGGGGGVGACGRPLTEAWLNPIRSDQCKHADSRLQGVTRMWYYVPFLSPVTVWLVPVPEVSRTGGDSLAQSAPSSRCCTP